MITTDSHVLDRLQSEDEEDDAMCRTLGFSLDLSYDELPYSDDEVAACLQEEARTPRACRRKESTIGFLCANINLTHDSTLSFQYQPSERSAGHR